MLFVKIGENEWLNLSLVERVWVDGGGRGRLQTADGTWYTVDEMQEFTEKNIVGEIRRSMTIRQNAAKAKE